MKNKSRLAVILLSLLTLPIITALFMGCPGAEMEVKREIADLGNDKHADYGGEFETIVGANNEQATMKIDTSKSKIEIAIDYLDYMKQRQTAILKGTRIFENGTAKIVAKDKIAGKDEYIDFTFELEGKNIVYCIIKHPSDTINRVSVYARK